MLKNLLGSLTAGKRRHGTRRDLAKRLLRRLESDGSLVLDDNACRALDVRPKTLLAAAYDLALAERAHVLAEPARPAVVMSNREFSRAMCRRAADSLGSEYWLNRETERQLADSVIKAIFDDAGWNGPVVVDEETARQAIREVEEIRAEETAETPETTEAEEPAAEIPVVTAESAFDDIAEQLEEIAIVNADVAFEDAASETIETETPEPEPESEPASEPAALLIIEDMDTVEPIRSPSSEEALVLAETETEEAEPAVFSETAPSQESELDWFKLDVAPARPASGKKLPRKRQSLPQRQREPYVTLENIQIDID